MPHSGWEKKYKLVDGKTDAMWIKVIVMAIFHSGLKYRLSIAQFINRKLTLTEDKENIQLLIRRA
jgi:hypothetical protein